MGHAGHRDRATGPANGSGPARPVLSPSSMASPESGRGGTSRGRRAAGTGRGYLSSRCREPDVGTLGPIGRNLQRPQGELHDLVEDGPRHLDTEVAALARVLHVDRHDQLGVPGRRDADEARPVQAQAAALFGSAICAVPVLAAIEYPGISAQGSPTWASTQGTCCRMPISSWAVLAWMTRWLAGSGAARTGRWRRWCPPRWGVDPDAAVGDRGVDAGHLDRGDRDALAERQGVPLVTPPLATPGTGCRCSARAGRARSAGRCRSSGSTGTASAG